MQWIRSRALFQNIEGAMKIECEVIAAETTGDGVRVELQGKSINAAAWRGVDKHTLVIPGANRGETFHVGRKVMVTVEPK